MSRQGYARPVSGAPTFDLQAHSQHSDGELPAADVVAGAAAAGVELFSLTDHDTIDGVGEAIEAGGRHGVRVVAGVELTALRTDRDDLHLLGYDFDTLDHRLAERLETYRADRELRAQRMAQRLEELGLTLERAELEARRSAGKPIGRPHLAEAALAGEANAHRLRSEGIFGVGDFIETYLVPGAPAWLPRLSPTVEEAIAAVQDAGGLAVWAHPFFELADPEQVLEEIDRMRAAGLDGVECFYPTHDAEQVHLLCQRCEEAGLLRTGSSDFHGPHRPGADRFRDFELYGRTPELGRIAG
jgi:predicted metal-dependent phosphoesterase TrpH